MSTTHNTRYPVWSECDQHQEPDLSDDPRYDCAGNNPGCSTASLLEWPFPDEWETYTVACLGCTTFYAEQEEWECTHEYGEGLDWSGVICKTVPPRHYCKECSEANEDGEWGQHEDFDEAIR
ncbi:hypothetical protein [Arthrobacter sp. CP30]